jgi:hypothetical protein
MVPDYQKNRVLHFSALRRQIVLSCLAFYFGIKAASGPGPGCSNLIPSPS